MSEREQLFRSEVLVRHSNRHLGAPVLQHNALASVFVWLSVGLVVSAVTLLVITRYQETETARGVLVPVSGAHRVVAPFSATVQDIAVRAGEQVHKGQVLASLQRATFDQHGQNVQLHESSQLQQQRRLLMSEQTLQTRLFMQQQDQIQAAMAELDVSAALLAKEMALLTHQQQLSESNLVALRKLIQGHAISRAQLEQAQLQHLAFELAIEQASQRAQSISMQRDSQQAQLDNLVVTNEQARLRSRKELQQLDQALSRQQNESQLTVVAATDGVVSAVAVESGLTVQAQQPLFYVTSGPEQIMASLYLPSRVLGKVYPGQAVLLSYEAYDYQYYGRYSATISSIDRASLDPREHLLPVPGIQEPVFRVEAQLDQHYVEGPDIYRLQSGLLFTADIVLAEMSLLEYIFRPVLRLRARLT